MPKRETYHHGDLKAALVDAALGLIAERGVAALSVAEVARRAGVSGGAPYRHFPSRRALLAAAATAAAHELAERLRRVRADDPIGTTAAAMAEYTRFAAEHGAGFDLIYADELRGHDDQALLDAGRSVTDSVLPALLAVTKGDAPAALALFERQVAAAHGHAVLLRSGFLARRQATVDDVAENVAAVARTLAEAAARADGSDIGVH